jgi:hypothetical protein
VLTKAGGRRRSAGGCFCNGDLCPAPKTFRLKRRGFRPDFFDNPDSAPHRAIMLVSAYIVERGLILPPQVVESKTNEIKALPELIKLLALKGVVFAFDAINTQKKLAS